MEQIIVLRGHEVWGVRRSPAPKGRRLLQGWNLVWTEVGQQGGRHGAFCGACPAGRYGGLSK